MIGGRIDRYVGSAFLWSYATAFLVVVGLVFLIDMAANVDDLLEGNGDGSRQPIGLILRFYALNLPFLFLQSGPFVTLTAGLFTVTRLLRHSEIAACLSAGISARRVMGPVFVGGALAAVAMFGLREWASHTVIHKRDAVLTKLESRESERVFEDLWVRDLAGNVARLDEFRPATGDPPIAEIRGLRGTVRQVGRMVNIDAERAVYTSRGNGEGWRLVNGIRYEGGANRAESEVEWLEEIEFSPAVAVSFHRARTNPLELSFSEALELGRRDPDNVVYQTLMQYHLTFPLANLVLLLVGIPLLMRHERARGVEGLARALLLCVFYFGADFIFRNLGIGGSLDPLLAGWTPVLLFGSLGIVLFDSMRS